MRGPIVFCLNPSPYEALRKPVTTTQSEAPARDSASGELLPAPDAVDLGVMVLDPASLKDLPDDTVRPGGMACSVKADNKGFNTRASGGLSLRLTEFPDPAGKVVYFRLRDLRAAAPDELFSGGGK
jgi:hypothetical protein